MQFNIIIKKDVNKSCTWGWVKARASKRQETQMEKRRRQKTRWNSDGRWIWVQ
jgi:hypothetical protein